MEEGDTINLSIAGDVFVPGLEIEWLPGTFLSCDTCITTSAYPLVTSVVNITILDSNQCQYFLETEIIVHPNADTIEADAVYVPNVFTPNGDGVNDFFSIYSRQEETHLNKLALFDRWGNMVYYIEDIPLKSLTGWDGTFRNKKMGSQVFAYAAFVELSTGEVVFLKGDVTLLR